MVGEKALWQLAMSTDAETILQISEDFNWRGDNLGKVIEPNNFQVLFKG